MQVVNRQALVSLWVTQPPFGGWTFRLFAYFVCLFSPSESGRDSGHEPSFLVLPIVALAILPRSGTAGSEARLDSPWLSLQGSLQVLDTPSAVPAGVPVGGVGSAVSAGSGLFLFVVCQPWIPCLFLFNPVGPQMGLLWEAGPQTCNHTHSKRQNGGLGSRLLKPEGPVESYPHKR